MAFPTAAKAMAGLQAYSVAEYALFFRSRSILRTNTSLNATSSSMGNVTCLASRISDASTTKEFTFGSFSGYNFASLLIRLFFFIWLLPLLN